MKADLRIYLAFIIEDLQLSIIDKEMSIRYVRP